MIQVRRGVLAPTLAVGLLLAATPAALARPQFQETQVDAGGDRKSVTLRILGGCDGQAIDRVQLSVPEGVVGVVPEAVAGWAIASEEVTTEPYELFGEELTSRIGTVTWTGALPDDQYADLGFAAVFRTPGDVLFPVVLGCGTNEVTYAEAVPEGTDPTEIDLRAPALLVVEPVEPVDVVALQATVDQIRTDLDAVRTQAGDVRVPALRDAVERLQEAMDRLRERVAALDGGPGGEESPEASPAS
jgi:uncharacterized protein YcnI